jgi:choline dehydrogenase-like flavoprotein
MHVGLMRAYSRGRIELRSADPAAPPRILCNYLHDERDRRAMRSTALVAPTLHGSLEPCSSNPGGDVASRC